ncbi:MAG: glutamyl-tRNA reductase [Verrucomicrobia bacterium]|nr:MAG: glutamyl-tRNA reductase [Verrucomicrobiota bacterium]
MNILCTGINYKTTPIHLRERFAVPSQEVKKLLNQIRQIEGLNEAVVLSTCNRVEFYVATICPQLSVNEIQNLLKDRAAADSSVRWYHHTAPQSVRHLFRVVSGLDSMVLGETEVLGQVKRAYAEALGLGATSRHLNKLFQNAFRVAKSVRSETLITRGPTSVGAAAVELAEKIFGSLSACKVMVLGAGETSERTVRSLLSRGVRSIIVSNRTYDRAVQLAAEVGGVAMRFDHWQDAFSDIDILISSTRAPHALLTEQKLAPLMKRRRQRPLFLIDLGVPRNIQAEVNNLEGVFLYDIDSLQEIARQSLAIRRQELNSCEVLIEQHVHNFVGWIRRATADHPYLEHPA